MDQQPARAEIDPLQAAAGGVLAALAVALLVYGAPFLIPLAVAALIWFSLDELAHLLQRVRLRGLALPWWACLTMAILAMLGFLVLIADIITDNVRAVVEAAPRYQTRLETLLVDVYGLLQMPPPENLGQLVAGVDLPGLVTSLGAGLTGLLGQAGIVLVYVGFLLVEQGRFEKKLAALFPDTTKRRRMERLFVRISERTRTYIAVKTVVSILTGAISYIVLRLLEVDFAAFWGLVIFLLNFIPTVGSILGVIFPALLTLMQFDTLTPFLIVTLGLGATQFVIGNIVEPQLMGQSLNLSPLVIILALFVWGAMWGVMGLFLGVPLTVVLVIVLAHFQRTRWVAILLSTDGKVIEGD